MIDIICAFIGGFLLATVVLWSVHRQHKKAWQSEYRRLMGGIMSARRKMMCCKYLAASKVLRATYNGDE